MCMLRVSVKPTTTNSITGENNNLEIRRRWCGCLVRERAPGCTCLPGGLLKTGFTASRANLNNKMINK